MFLNHKKTFLKDEAGTTAIEYALIAALVSIMLVSTLDYVGKSIKKTFSEGVLAALNDSVSPLPPASRPNSSSGG